MQTIPEVPCNCHIDTFKMVWGERCGEKRGKSERGKRGIAKIWGPGLIRDPGDIFAAPTSAKLLGGSILFVPLRLWNVKSRAIFGVIIGVNISPLFAGLPLERLKIHH
jgi:hypothetical protein